MVNNENINKKIHIFKFMFSFISNKEKHIKKFH